jgi:glucose/arabinose dehydrogenase
MKTAYLRLLAAGAAALALAACSPTPGIAPPAGPTGGPGDGQASTSPDGRPFTVTEATAFDEPWAMAFLPGTNYLAITERSGRLHLRNQETGQLTEVSGVPEVAYAGQGGFGDIVPGPRFDEDDTVYLTWAEARPDGTSGAVMGRAQLVIEGNQARLDGLTTIWRQEPTIDGDGHFGHRIAFSPGGAYLYLTSSDRQQMTPAQDLGNNLGKILRLTADGTPAAGNPYATRGGVSTQIWTYGHRNPLGIAFAPDGRLWISEMGPQGGDEVNLIEPGRNYGWPNASNGSHYGGAPIPDHAPGDGYAAPKVSWNPSVSPGSLMIYNGTMFPEWQGDAFIGALSGEALIRVDLDGANARKGDQWAMGARIREVEQGPDDSIWILEDAGNGRLLQLSPIG